MSVLKRRFPRHLQEFIFSMWKWNVNNESYISNVLYECIMRELVNANGIRLKNKMRFCFFFFLCYRDFGKNKEDSWTTRIFLCPGHNRHRDRGDKLTKERREFSDKPQVNFLQRVPR